MSVIQIGLGNLSAGAGLSISGTTLNVNVAGSIIISAALITNSLQLQGDVLTPGNNYFYGTDGSGTKGWYTISGSEVSSITGTAGQVLANGTSGSPVTGAVTLTLATALVSINSITSVAGQPLVLATGTTGTALTIASANNQITIGTGSQREPLIITSSSNTDTIFHITNTGTSGLDWQLRSTATSSGIAVAGALAFFSSGLNGSQVYIDGNTGDLVIGGTNASAATWTTTGIQFAVKAATFTNTTNASPASAVFTSFAAPTLAASNAITTTIAATVYIAGAPVQGTNQTITNSYGLWNVGTTRLDGIVTLNNDFNIVNGRFNIVTTATSGNLLTLESSVTNGFAEMAFRDSSATGKLFIGYGNSAVSSPFTSTAYIETASGVPLVIFTGGGNTAATFSAANQSLTLAGTVASSSVSTGTLVLSGASAGLGVAGAAYIGGNINAVGNNITFAGGTTLVDSGIGSLTISPISTNGQVFISNTGGSSTNPMLKIGTTGATDKPASIMYQVRNTSYNWLAGAQYNSNNGFEITASTATGGSTFSSPLLVVYQSGNVSIANGSTPDPGIVFQVTGARSSSSWTTTGIKVNVTGETFTNTSATGTYVSATFTSFAAPVLAATNVSVVTTDAATVYIAGGPTAGTNQTITNSWGLWNVGKSRLDGTVTFAAIPIISRSTNLGLQFNETGGTHFNWQIGSDLNNNNQFEITPSTVVGGTTFSSPAIQVKADATAQIFLNYLTNATLGIAIPAGFGLTFPTSTSASTAITFFDSYFYRFAQAGVRLETNNLNNTFQVKTVDASNSPLFEIKTLTGTNNTIISNNWASGSGTLYIGVGTNSTGSAQMNITNGGVVTLIGTTNATSATTGTLVLSGASGGIGVAGNIFVAGYGAFGAGAQAGDGRTVLSVAGTNTTDTIIQLYNSTVSNNTWQFRAEGSAASGAVAPGDFSIFSQTYNGFPIIIRSTTGNTIINASLTVTGDIVNSSDARLKNTIAPLATGLDLILKLNPVSYKLNGDKTGRAHFGLIAQEVNQTLGHTGWAGSSIVDHDSVSDTYGLAYSQLIAPLIKGEQELHKEIQALKKQVAKLIKERKG